MNNTNIKKPAIGNIFAKEEWRKGEKKFKRFFKKSNISLKITSSKVESRCIFTFLSDENAVSSIDCIIEFSQEDEVLYANPMGLLHNREVELFNRFFKELGALVKELGINIIIAKNRPYGNSTPFEQYKAFIPTSVYPGNEIPKSIVGNFAIDNNTDANHLSYYFPLIEGMIEKRVLTYSRVLDAANKQKNADITFRENQFYANQSFVGLLFYYEGFIGRLHFYYGNKTTVYLIEGDMWNKENIISEKFVANINDIPAIFNDMISYVVQKNALPNALYPPTHLFKKYLESLPYYLPVNVAHECLMKEMTAKEIDVATLTDKNPVMSFDYESGKIFLVQLFGRYLVIYSESGYAESFTNKNEALLAFQKQITNYEEKKYKIHLDKAHSFLESVTKKIT